MNKTVVAAQKPYKWTKVRSTLLERLMGYACQFKDGWWWVNTPYGSAFLRYVDFIKSWEPASHRRGTRMKRGGTTQCQDVMSSAGNVSVQTVLR